MKFVGPERVQAIGDYAPQLAEPWVFDERERCCEDDFGGSHYHCAYCGKPGGMYGCSKGAYLLCPPIGDRPEGWARFVVPGGDPLDFIAYSVRERAAVICAIASSDARRYVQDDQHHAIGYGEIASELGFETEALDLALYALWHALEYTAPETSLAECDAEAEALIRSGWKPESSWDSDVST